MIASTWLGSSSRVLLASVSWLMAMTSSISMSVPIAVRCAADTGHRPGR